MPDPVTEERDDCGKEPCLSALAAFANAGADLTLACQAVQAASQGRTTTVTVGGGVIMGSGTLAIGSAYVHATALATVASGAMVATAAASALAIFGVFMLVVAVVAVVVTTVSFIVDQVALNSARKECDAKLLIYTAAFHVCINPRVCKPKCWPTFSPCSCV